MTLHHFAGKSPRNAFVLALTVFVLAAAAAIFPQCAHAADEPWLVRLNELRASADIAPAVGDLPGVQGRWLHSRYQAMNGRLGHSEDPSNPWYTTDGANHTGNCCAPVGGADAIDCWATAPYHATVLLQPGHQSFGLSTFEQTGKAVATLEMGWDWSAMRTASYPVLWPGPGSTLPHTRYWGGETPDPMAGSGYTNPIGLPIVVMFGGEKTFSNSHVRCNGSELQHFVRSTDRATAFIIPRRPLERGKTYDVAITASGVAYRWSFTVGQRRATEVSISEREDSAEDGVVLSVALKSGGLPSAKHVKIERSTDGATWQTATWVQTSSVSGSASSKITVTSATYYRASFAGDELSAPATSEPVLVGADDGRVATTLRIQAPGEVSTGQSVALLPALEAGGVALAGESLILQRSTDGETWAAYRTYSQAELFAMPVVMDAAGYFRLHYVGSAEFRPSSSAVWKVKAAVAPDVKVAHRLVLAKPSRSPVRVGRAFTASVTLAPRHSGLCPAIKVQAFRSENGGWVLKRTFTARPSGDAAAPGARFSVTASLPSAGKWKLRASACADGGHSAGVSGVQYLTAY